MTTRHIVQEIVAAIRPSAAPRSAMRSRLRLEARALLADRRRARRLMAHRMRRALRQHRLALFASVRGPFGPRAAESGAATIHDSASVHDGPGVASSAGVWEWLPEAAEEEGEAPGGNGLRAEVLRAIGRHPEGAPATDIGNEIGVDWRRVLGIAAELVDEGAIERVGRQFYPGKRV